jgi:hypothetical protein
VPNVIPRWWRHGKLGVRCGASYERANRLSLFAKNAKSLKFKLDHYHPWSLLYFSLIPSACALAACVARV